jgi:hypothetical protein
MEKNKATKYIPMQNRKECQPPIAESVVFAVIGFNFSFFKGIISDILAKSPFIPLIGIVKDKNNT